MFYRRKLCPAFFTVLLALLPAVARGGIITAASGVQQFTFQGTSSGGTASATLTFQIVESGGNSTLIVGVKNTSPIVLNSSSAANSPGITGFGFDLARLNSSGGVVDPNPVHSTWKLTAQQKTTSGFQTVILGDNDLGTDLGDSPPDLMLWQISQPGTQGSITMDLLTNNGGNGQNALYNPLATSGEGSSPFYTYAELTLVFNGLTNLAVEWEIDVTSPFKDYSPFVRMQNVGSNGAGSLKLQPQGPPTSEVPPPNPLPEPASIAAWGLGLVIAGLGYRRHRKA